MMKGMDMPNRNYIRGRNKEYEAMRYLNTMYLALRTAGSHSPFDVVGLGKNNVMLVQLKRRKDMPKSYKGWKSLRTKSINMTKKIFKENKENIPLNAWVCLWTWLDYVGWLQINYCVAEDRTVVRYIGKSKQCERYENTIKQLSESE